jgi:hypothetical protein
VSAEHYARWKPVVARLEQRPPPLALAAAALLPLAGVLWLDWPAAALLGFYWAETVAIGLVHVARLRAAHGVMPNPQLDAALAANPALTPAQRAEQLRNAHRVVHFLMPGLFALHFGIFCAVHAGLLAALFDGAFADLLTPLGLAALAAIVLQQGLDYRRFRRDPECTALPRSLLFLQPYPRVLVLQLVLILGALPALAGLPTVAAVLMTAFKLLAELGGVFSLSSILARVASR